MTEQEKIKRLGELIDQADAIVVGTASGMSAASGKTGDISIKTMMCIRKSQEVCVKNMATGIFLTHITITV